jgi:peptidoglycan hydrolase-like protein with peptidoglycan-binding domain
MAGSSKRRKKRGHGFVLRGFVATGEMVARNPAIAGGSTAFLVALSFVSANALWYQPHFYNSAFFATRSAAQYSSPVPAEREQKPRIAQPTARPVPPPDVTETTGAVPPPAAQSTLAGEAEISRVQSALADLGLYKGEVDGLSGPNTRDAIASYQRIVGIEETGNINAALLQHLGLVPARPAAGTPSPSPRPTSVAAVLADARPEVVAEAGPDAPAAQTRKIQAGLKAFGNDGIEIDGVAGADTQAALREFQSLFGLQVTGEPNPEVLAKMKAIGLVN